MVDPPAPDLRAIRARFNRAYEPWSADWSLYLDSERGRHSLRALLAAYDAQAARLAELENLVFAYESGRAPINPLAARLAAVERVLRTHKWHVTCCEDLLEGLEAAIGPGAVGAGEARDGE